MKTSYFDFLILNSGSGSHRLVACVDSLGLAMKLTVVDECKMELVTDRGTWILDRRAFEPAFDTAGFVGVELPALSDQMALYFDLRIAAALVKARMRWAHTDERIALKKGMEIPLYDEDESREIIRRELEGDSWAFEMLASSVTWIDEKGHPIPVGSVGGMLGGVWTIGKLDARLMELCLLARPDSEERRSDRPYQYLSRRIETFLSVRYSHNQELSRYLDHKS